ncbi:hypothetical protein H6P81_014114 [Aristolochia fimbriata]|uniref:Antifreeze protein n=1 Tax=Aristolochia fimbriata TaxID=158543 RepID=A0AAV7EJE0_ARIFI|nr:hypothetical protein H6P81_014114 [Aristolochia fimbriata]
MQAVRTNVIAKKIKTNSYFEGIMATKVQKNIAMNETARVATADEPKETAPLTMLGDGAISPTSSVVAATPKFAQPMRTTVKMARAMADLRPAIAN